MARLKPIEPEIIITLSIPKEMNKQLTDEMKRINVQTRSELIRMIFEEYFKEPIPKRKYTKKPVEVVLGPIGDAQ